MIVVTQGQRAAPSGIGLGTALLVVGVMLLAALLGLVLSSGSLLLMLPFAALIAVILVAALPVGWSVWALFAATFVLVGPMVYFGRIEQARWLPPLLGMLMAVPLLVRLVQPARDAGRGVAMPAFTGWLLLFLASAAFSTAIDRPLRGELLGFWRNYLAYWPLVFLLALGTVPVRTMCRMWKLLLGVALLQLPLALYQNLFMSRQAARSASWDVVVGSFPGNAEGGGASAGMGVFVLTAMLIALALWRRRQLGTPMLALVAVAGVATIAMAEVKAVVLLIPVAVALMYGAEIARRPLQAVLALCLAAVLSAGLLAVYSHTFYDRAAYARITTPNKPESPLEAISRQLDPEPNHEQLHSVGRMLALSDWWRRTAGRGDVHHALFGHGLGATQVSKLGVGELVPRFSYPLDQTATSMLLWETGLVGHALFVLLLLSAARTAARLRRHALVPAVHQAILHALAVALVLQCLTLPYKSFIFKTAPSQLLLALMLGYVAWWAREVARAGRMRPGAATGRTG